MTFFDELAAVHEDALVRWDEAEVQLPEGVEPHVGPFYRDSFEDGGLTMAVSLNEGMRWLAVWIPTEASGRWLVRRVSDVASFGLASQSTDYDPDRRREGRDFEALDSFTDRVRRALEACPHPLIVDPLGR